MHVSLSRSGISQLLSKIGNVVHASVPVGIDEDKDNRVERTWGKPRDPAGLLNHAELLWCIGGYEPDRGSTVAGHRGYFLKDAGVLLNQVSPCSRRLLCLMHARPSSTTPSVSSARGTTLFCSRPT